MRKQQLQKQGLQRQTLQKQKLLKQRQKKAYVLAGFTVSAAILFGGLVNDATAHNPIPHNLPNNHDQMSPVSSTTPLALSWQIISPHSPISKALGKDPNYSFGYRLGKYNSGKYNSGKYSWQTELLLPVYQPPAQPTPTLPSPPPPAVTSTTIPPSPPPPATPPPPPPAIAPQVPAHTNSATPTQGILQQLALCESGGNYQADTGNGYYGAYQFTIATWQALGYQGIPSQAPAALQNQAAQRLQSEQGWTAWPACAAQLGL